jgi:hypothetical protein
MKTVLPLMLALLGASTSLAHAGKAPAPVKAVQTVQSDFKRGIAQAKADYAQGKGGWHYWHYSNMPNGPDDPVRVRENDLFVALLHEKGIVPMSTNTGCIPVSGVAEFAAGYNSVADTLLKEKFGDDYMARLKAEVARRMEEAAPGA